MLHRKAHTHPRESCPKLDMTGQQGRTHQEFVEDADINVLMKRFKVTGQFPPTRPGALYGDFSNVGEFQDALERIRAVEAGFDALPSELRKWADNDPATLLERLDAGETHELLLPPGAQPTAASVGSEATDSSAGESPQIPEGDPARSSAPNKGE